MADDPNPNPAPDPEPDPKPDTEPEAFKGPQSQAELDRIVEERLARERRRTSDYDELKAKATKYDELEESQKDELQREKDAREKAEREKDEALASARTTLLRASVIAEAASQNAVKPEQVFRLLDTTEIEFDDDGQPKGVAEAVKALLAENDHLVGSAGGTHTGNGADQGARGGGAEAKLSLEAYKALSPEEQRDAVREGKVDLTPAGRS